jgi:hypothetical protein
VLVGQGSKIVSEALVLAEQQPVRLDVLGVALHLLLVRLGKLGIALGLLLVHLGKLLVVCIHVRRTLHGQGRRVALDLVRISAGHLSMPACVLRKMKGHR